MTPVPMHALRLGILSLMLGVLFGCDGLPITSIRDLQQQSDSLSEVYLTGEVITQVPLLGKQAYELKDATGTIWVITRETLPPENTRVKIKGKIQQKKIQLGPENLTELYVEEAKRL